MAEKPKYGKKYYQELGIALDPNKIRKNAVTKKKSTKTDFVRKLEQEANKPVKKKFKFGKVMCEELEYYIQKYQDNYEAMARDKKNIYQESPGQLRYKINKYIKLHKQGEKN